MVKMKVKEILNTVKKVLRERGHFILFLILLVSSVYLFYYLSDVINLYHNNSLAFVITTLVLSFFISTFLALNLTLIIYQFINAKRLGYKEGSVASTGGFFGAIASGCPVCGSTLLSIFGLSGFLAVLPLKGIEIKALSLGLLLFSTHLTTKQIHNRCKACKVKK